MIGATQESTCGSCGRVNVGAKFCDQCGKALTVRVSCRSCGHMNVDARFCEQCGTPLREDMNPYAPPADDAQERVEGGRPLASRGARLGAAIVDAIAVSLVNLPLLLAADLVRFDGTTLPLSRMVLAAGLGFIVFTAVQGFFLLRGQTLGKRMLGLRMVDVDTGEPAYFGRLLAMRYLPLSLVSLVPIVGPLLGLCDTLMIFRSDRRCLHDLLANTRVVSER